ncbi:hypothetical protein PGIGA_G00092830 [Pangasianodon gigas]|uniref:Uncharacterized protein n=1 Tax=Pangasianodon gigas TaxID=30993 RepID=A0ACC5XCY1_PANGG|nr:hypothetical protein [Pangasianodon gigas]
MSCPAPARALVKSTGGGHARSPAHCLIRSDSSDALSSEGLLRCWSSNSGLTATEFGGNYCLLFVISSRCTRTFYQTQTSALMKLRSDSRAGVGVHHAKVKPKLAVLNMLKRLDKIRFRGSKRDEFLDLAESPTASDNEGIEDILMKPRLSLRDSEELREPAGSGALNMAAVQDLRSDTERLNEVKGHLEIALLEKHFLQEELRKLREETNVEMLKQELERERCRRLDLEQKMNDVLKGR